MTRLPPYWLPQNEADIQRAIAEDCLSETHYLDCKREIDTKADRKETARDLASFAIDGGGLLIGVHEDKANRTFSLAPQSLVGLAERIEDIAWSTIDPTLDVIPHEIDSDRGEGLGYLLVEVRPSPFAPHMVDGVYYGRGEKVRIRLTDPQVRRYHAQRQSIEERVAELLDEEITRDPVPVERRRRGHLYLVAQPLTAPPAAARSLVRSANVMELRQIVQMGETRLKGFELAGVRPSATEASRLQRRARGVALCSDAASGPGRTIKGAEDQYVDIEFREDGGIRALICRATYADGQFEGKDNLLIFDWLIVAYAVRLAAWTAAMGQSLGYRGMWGLGLHASGLRGLQGFTASTRTTYAPHFNDEAHRAVTTTSLADLEDRWQQLASELVGGMLFALDTPKQTFAEFVNF